jgi:hypothetical protein
MVEPSPPGRTDAADGAACVEGDDPALEPGGQEVAAAKCGCRASWSSVKLVRDQHEGRSS